MPTPSTSCTASCTTRVGNIPGAVPYTSTYALTNATMPYALALATHGVAAAVKADPELGRGVNTVDGSVTNEAVASALDRPAVDLADALAT